MDRKRNFDLTFSLLGIAILSPIFILITILIILFSGLPVFFIQTRVGKHGVLFNVIKYRTMIYTEASNDKHSNITVLRDERVTQIGKFLRKWKLDELPTIMNVILGQMSLVGPRPDVPGYTDNLVGDDIKILEMRPGITGSASLKYANEEMLLSQVENPQQYNDEVIFPDKVKINLEYMNNWSLLLDIKIIFRTIFRRNY